MADPVAIQPPRANTKIRPEPVDIGGALELVDTGGAPDLQDLLVNPSRLIREKGYRVVTHTGSTSNQTAMPSQCSSSSKLSPGRAQNRGLGHPAAI
jgi:hypothetical protein